MPNPGTFQIYMMLNYPNFKGFTEGSEGLMKKRKNNAVSSIKSVNIRKIH